MNNAMIEFRHVSKSFSEDIRFWPCRIISALSEAIFLALATAGRKKHLITAD